MKDWKTGSLSPNRTLASRRRRGRRRVSRYGIARSLGLKLFYLY
uniref:Uncharacterized protein n=1 Tax=Arundo donax TaxID=35708 RepID=A0A0A9DLW7_ARUDO